MCGIAAIFSYRSGGPPVDSAELLRTREAMRTRGPDGSGSWFSPDGHVGLAHRRLAVIDLTPGGAQPMVTADGRVAITFNGEIYNYRELRQQLVNKGYRFTSNSDTEVLLHLYDELGADMLRHLRGMYALALWDQKRQTMLLARDPFGIKPLYFSDDGRVLRVASQVKALVAGGNVDTSPEAAGHVGFLLWGHVPEPYTLHRGVRALPPGTTMQLELGGRLQQKVHYSVVKLFSDAESSPGSLSDRPDRRAELDHAVRDSIRAHLVSDVPVGLFLSAGIDSATIAGLVSEADGNLNTVTLGFREYQGTVHDEVPLAEQVARHYGARHQTVWVTKQDFEEELPRILAAMDQPSIDGVNMYFVARAAASAGLKVALSGVGGDELFGGYSHFHAIPNLVRAFGWTRRCRFVGKALRFASAPMLKPFTSSKYAGLLEYGGTFDGAYLLRRALFMPWELKDILGRDVVRQGLCELDTMGRLKSTHMPVRSARLKISALELNWYLRSQLLRDMDWASMAHSLEVRTPLVDWNLQCALAPLLVEPRPLEKSDFASLVRRPLPHALVTRQKTGFSIPVQSWLPVRRAERGLRAWAKVVMARSDSSLETVHRWQQ